MLTHADIQKAHRISRAIEEYLTMTGETNLRSTEVYPYLRRKGLVPEDQDRGRYFRNFLKKLKRNNALHLIPQCAAIDRDEVYTNWYFHKAGKKLKLNYRILTAESGVTIVDAIRIANRLIDGCHPLTGEKEPAGSWLFAPLVVECLRLLRVSAESLIPAQEPDPAPVPASKMSLDKLASRVAQWPLAKPNDSVHDGIREMRKTHPRAYEPWLPEEDALLRANAGHGIPALATAFQRNPGAICARMERLGLYVPGKWRQ